MIVYTEFISDLSKIGQIRGIEYSVLANFDLWISII